MQLLFAFIILSIIMSVAILLMMLSKNSRSHKVRQLCQDKQWQYQEFVNFNEPIKNANFGLLNYSQNAIFRHVISADANDFGLGFNFFDCRAIEPSCIHNCSVLLFNLNLDAKFSKLHTNLSPKGDLPESDQGTVLDKHYFLRIKQQQKLMLVKPHYAFEQHDIYSNNPVLLEEFLQQHLTNDNKGAQKTKLSSWLLAHPHLHIEISNGMLLAYQPNQLLSDEAIIPAIEHIAEISQSLSRSL